jgi:hypothetical protein
VLRRSGERQERVAETRARISRARAEQIVREACLSVLRSSAGLKRLKVDVSWQLFEVVRTSWVEVRSARLTTFVGPRGDASAADHAYSGRGLGIRIA